MLVSEVLEVSECQEFLPLIFNILLTTQLDANMDTAHSIVIGHFIQQPTFTSNVEVSDGKSLP